MNAEFEAALKLIDMGSYDRAAEHLSSAIEAEMKNDNEAQACEYRCVLGELLVNLDRREEARAEFALALDYCQFANALPKQKAIAELYIDVIDKNLPAPEFGRKEAKPAARHAGGLVPKPVQDKAFISRQMNKKHR